MTKFCSYYGISRNTALNELRPVNALSQRHCSPVTTWMLCISIAVMAVVVLAVRLFMLTRFPLVTWEDNLHYLMLARSIREGRFFQIFFRNEWFSPGSVCHIDTIYPPLFPMFLAAALGLGGGATATARAACIVVNVVSVVPFALIARRLTLSAAATFWASTAFLWSADMLGKSVVGMSESLAVPLALLCLWLYLRFQKSGSFWAAVACGAAAAAALLTRMEYIVLPIGFLGTALVGGRPPHILRRSWILSHLGILVLAMAAWFGWEAFRSFYLCVDHPLPQYWHHILVDLNIEQYPPPQIQLDGVTFASLVGRRLCSGGREVIGLALARLASNGFLLLVGFGAIAWLVDKAAPKRPHLLCLNMLLCSILVYAMYLNMSYRSIKSHQLSGLIPWLLLLAGSGVAFLLRAARSLPFTKTGLVTPWRAVLTIIFFLLSLYCYHQARGTWGGLHHGYKTTQDIMQMASWIRNHVGPEQCVLARRSVSVSYGSQRQVVMIPVFVSEEGLRELAKAYGVTHLCDWQYEGPIPVEWSPVARSRWGTLYLTGQHGLANQGSPQRLAEPLIDSESTPCP